MNIFTLGLTFFFTCNIAVALPAPAPEPVAVPAPEPKLAGKALEDALDYLNAPEPWETSEIPVEVSQRLWG